jgi:hypothetical protein
MVPQFDGVFLFRGSKPIHEKEYTLNFLKSTPRNDLVLNHLRASGAA